MKNSDKYFIMSNIFVVGTFAAKTLFGMGFCCVACIFYLVLFIIATKEEME
jgi:hypothetical protein